MVSQPHIVSLFNSPVSGSEAHVPLASRMDSDAGALKLHTCAKPVHFTVPSLTMVVVSWGSPRAHLHVVGMLRFVLLA